MRTGRVVWVLAVVGCGLALLAGVLSRPAGAAAPAASAWFAAPAGTGTACTQAQPCALQTALVQAANGDTIYAAGGTYTGTQNPMLDITKDVSILGGWNGGPNHPGIVRWPETFPTILNGQAQRRVIRVNGAYSVTLDGLAVGGGLSSDGAGVRVSGGAVVTLRHCGVALNFATTGEGAGVRADGASTVIIEDSAFVSNTAVLSYGGALSASAGSRIVMRDSAVSHNTANLGGAGLRLNGVNATLTNLTIAENTGSGGDGLYAVSTVFTLTDSIVVSNTYGVHTDGTGTVVLSHNDVWSNSSGNYVGVANPTGTLGNISLDPLFVTGSYLGYYLSQVAAGQAVNSPALDAGDGPATALPYYDYLTTRTDNALDTGTVDLGYHHRRLYSADMAFWAWLP